MSEFLDSLIRHIDPNPDWVVFDGSWPRPSPLSRALDGSVARIVHRKDRESKMPEDGDTLLTPFTDQHFDLIFLGLPSIMSPASRQVVGSFKRVLKSGGRLFLTAPLDVVAAEVPAARQDWTHAMELERLWVDWNEIVTQNQAGTEYRRYTLPSAGAPGEKKGAISPIDCYLYLSAIK